MIFFFQKRFKPQQFLSFFSSHSTRQNRYGFKHFFTHPHRFHFNFFSFQNYSKKMIEEENENEKAIKLFQNILKYETVSSFGPINGSYTLCSQWIFQQFQNLEGIKVISLPESKENKPIILVEWEGSDLSLPCIFLNCHYDVVPIIESAWSVPAFEGLRQDGKIYGRGAQDMKCVVVQYIIAIQRLKRSGHIPLRTIRLSFVPDEEIGGADGMRLLMSSTWFQEKQIAIALDEVIFSFSLFLYFVSFSISCYSIIIEFNCFRVWHQKMSIIQFFMVKDYLGGLM